MTQEKNVDSIMKEYDSVQGLYKDFSKKIKELLSVFLETQAINVHSIAFREKGKDSLREKLEDSENKYMELGNVTDLAGIRVITYFSDDVDKLANIIEKEFDVDYSNSIDKRKKLDPDRFGYLSLHYIIKLREDRLKLTEYNRFASCCAEIQVRTILQHTWAEIEHDLGYKSELAIPTEERRSFSRLAGLLELADIEFLRIRNSLDSYERQVSSQISINPETVLIDSISLKSFIINNYVVKEIDSNISNSVGRKIMDEIPDSSSIERIVSRMNYFEIKTISELEHILLDNTKQIVKFAELWLTRKKYKKTAFSMGICLFYLGYLFVAKRDSAAEAYGYLEKNFIGSDKDREVIAKELITIYRENKSILED